MAVNLQSIDQHLNSLRSVHESKPYQVLKTTLHLELELFPLSLPSPKEICSATPQDVIRLLVWKDRKGKTKIHEWHFSANSENVKSRPSNEETLSQKIERYTISVKSSDIVSMTTTEASGVHYTFSTSEIGATKTAFSDMIMKSALISKPKIFLCIGVGQYSSNVMKRDLYFQDFFTLSLA